MMPLRVSRRYAVTFHTVPRLQASLMLTYRHLHPNPSDGQTRPRCLLLRLQVVLVRNLETHVLQLLAERDGQFSESCLRLALDVLSPSPDVPSSVRPGQIILVQVNSAKLDSTRLNSTRLNCATAGFCRAGQQDSSCARGWCRTTDKLGPQRTETRTKTMPRPSPPSASMMSAWYSWQTFSSASFGRLALRLRPAFQPPDLTAQPGTRAGPGTGRREIARTGGIRPV